MPDVLVIDDDRTIHVMVARALEKSGIQVRSAMTAEAALDEVKTSPPDVLLLDIQLPNANGLEVYQEIREVDRKLPVIFITNSDSSEVAIEAMSRGAYDYVLKPLDLPRLAELVTQAVETRRLMRVRVGISEVNGASGAQEDDDEDEVLIGRSPAMQEVYKAIGRAAPQDVIVLVRGESGTGKELVARAIYHHSARAAGPFLEINCAAIPDTLLESELFGHEKGAFTGAESRRIGKFERCSGGTIFLDEVGDMSPLIQSKVLRILQEQRFERVGGSQTLETDVRIIAATNRDLEKMVASGHFREDLYYRLNGYAIHIPPLRERGEDIELLVEFYLARISQRLNREVHGITPEAMEILRRYPWPGNVRELQGELNRAILKATGPLIMPANLSDEVRGYKQSTHEVATAQSETEELGSFIEARLAAGSTDLYAETLELVERQLLTEVLRTTNGNQSQAAATLGITRGCLRNKLRQLKITIGRTVNNSSAAAGKQAEQSSTDPAAV